MDAYPITTFIGLPERMTETFRQNILGVKRFDKETQ
jgi:hypothetical protein